MKELYKDVVRNLENPTDMVMTKEDETDFKKAVICHICEKRFEEKK
jgi:hypothetical protein